MQIDSRYRLYNLITFKLRREALLREDLWGNMRQMLIDYLVYNPTFPPKAPEDDSLVMNFNET
jgi:hypothetical protein